MSKPDSSADRKCHFVAGRVTEDQFRAIRLAKDKAARITGFAPTDQAIQQAAYAAFCERYQVQWPPFRKKARSDI